MIRPRKPASPESDKAIKARRAKARRKRQAASREPDTVPAWKRWLFGALLMAGGGVFIFWGVQDLVTWISALRAGAATIKTWSAMLADVPLGLAIAVIGPAFLLPTTSALRETIELAGMVAMLVLFICGVLLATIGSFAVTAITRQHGYHVCDVRHGTKTSFTTWAARDRACPSEDDED